MKKQKLRALTGWNLNVRANPRGSKSAFTQGNCEAAVTDIVRRVC